MFGGEYITLQPLTMRISDLFSGDDFTAKDVRAEALWFRINVKKEHVTKRQRKVLADARELTAAVFKHKDLSWRTTVDVKSAENSQKPHFTGKKEHSWKWSRTASHDTEAAGEAVAAAVEG